ncbi:MAG: YybH family protein [Gemmatimonadales bacterium]
MNGKSAQEIIIAQERAVLQRWHAGDPLGHIAHHADDATYFDPATPSRVDGIGALRDYLTPLEGKVNVPRFEIEHPHVQLHGAVGVLTFNLNAYSGEGELAFRWNSTEVYRRTAGQWKVIHSHWSMVEKTAGQ